MKQFYFLLGLPRSGSTVLESILNQNPYVYVTPTSPVLHLLNKNQEEFYKCPEVMANPFPEQLINISRAMFASAWEHRPEPYIIDKHRGWGKNIQAMNFLFNTKIKMIATVRDVPSIMASWLTLIRKEPNNFLTNIILEKGFEPTEENLLDEMWIGHVMDCVESLSMARKSAGDALYEIHYDDFIGNPKMVLNRITSFLGLPDYDYDFYNIQNMNKNQDHEAFGFTELHKIRPRLQKTSANPREVLGDHLFEKYRELEKQYL